MIAFIPARGGSLRIKDKNIKDFCGTPLIVRGVELIQRSFDGNIWVVTDSDKIANLVHNMDRVHILKQPTEDCQHGRDGGWYAHKYFIEQLKLKDDEKVLSYLCTSPLIFDSDLQKLLKIAYNK